MNKQCLQVNVYTTNEGYIRIACDEPYGEHDSVLEIHPDQVDLLRNWLQEAKDELKTFWTNEVAQ